LAEISIDPCNRYFPLSDQAIVEQPILGEIDTNNSAMKMRAVMPYEIFDSKGHIGKGPSINGLRKLKDELDSLADAHSFFQLNMFLRRGYASSVTRFREELAQLEHLAKDHAAKDSLRQLEALSHKCSDVVILATTY
jgi:hypothetical protein